MDRRREPLADSGPERQFSDSSDLGLPDPGVAFRIRGGDRAGSDPGNDIDHAIEGGLHILMATYDGGVHLPAQLGSFCDQTRAGWRLRVADDTPPGPARTEIDAILARFAREHPGRAIHVTRGPGRGSAANFLQLLRAPDLPDGAWVAFADQDDVWLPHKIDRALQTIREAETKETEPFPVLYGSATILTDARLGRRRLSRPFPRGPSFANALVQNIMGGNTLVLNAEAVRLARAEGAEGAGVPYHDWWLYQLISGAGGRVIFDPKPGILYRQHETNLLGANAGLKGGLARLGKIRSRDYAGWIDANLAALGHARALLTDENRALLDAFAELRRRPGGEVMRGLRRLGIHRQSWTGDRLLAAMARNGRL